MNLVFFYIVSHVQVKNRFYFLPNNSKYFIKCDEMLHFVEERSYHLPSEHYELKAKVNLGKGQYIFPC